MKIGTGGIMFIDPIDKKIIELLQENARMKNTQIAKYLNMTEGAIRKRIKRLEDEGIIQGYTTILSKDINGVEALIFLTLEQHYSPHEVLEKLNMNPKVKEAWLLTGQIDIIVKVHTNSPSELDEAVIGVRTLDGVKETTTHVILKHVMKPSQLVKELSSEND